MPGLPNRAAAEALIGEADRENHALDPAASVHGLVGEAPLPGGFLIAWLYGEAAACGTVTRMALAS